MQTISEEEFKKRYGTQGLTQFKTEPKKDGLFGDTSYIKNAFKSGVDQVKKGLDQASNGKGNPLALGQGALNIGVGAIGAAFSPLALVTKPIGTGLNYAADKLSETPLFKDPNAAYLPEQNNPYDKIQHGVEAVQNLATIAGTVGGSKAVVGAGSKALGMGANIAQSAENGLATVGANLSKYPKQIADRITTGKIEPKVQTILKESPASMFDEYIQTGQKALKDPRHLTPLEIAGNKATDVARTMKEDLGNIGKQKSAVIESVAKTRVPNVALEQIEKIKPLLQKKLTNSERSLVNEYLTELKSLGKNPGAGSLDATVDKLQATLYEKSHGVAIPTTPRVKAFINQSIGELNSKLKIAVDSAVGDNSYSSLNAGYGKKINMFNTLNKSLGEAGTKGGSLMKRFFSPQDAGTKNLFAAIKQDYGIDLGQHATLAKFVMDTLGDTRARSLLQMPPHTAAGIVGKVLDYAENKLTSPEKVLGKARTMTKPLKGEGEIPLTTIYRGQPKGQTGNFYTASKSTAQRYNTLNKNSEIIKKDISGLKFKKITAKEMIAEKENPDLNYDGFVFKHPVTKDDTYYLFKP